MHALKLKFFNDINQIKSEVSLMSSRKMLCCILIVVICTLLIMPLSSCNKQADYDEFKFIFITDMHIIANANITAQNYERYSTVNKMVHITEAIYRTVVDDIIESGIKYVFVGGDITDVGHEEAHKVAAEGFKKLKDNGVKVYVINGNHDIYSNSNSPTVTNSAERFKEIYADYGYNDALAQYDN